MRPAQVDVVLRVYDLSDLACIRSSLFTLLGQMRASPDGVLGESLHVHLMTQRFNVAQSYDMRGGLADLLALDERLGLTLHNWDYASPFDLRVPLLNMALEETAGRYLIFLESADCLYPAALATLVARINETGCVAALGGVRIRSVRWWGDVFLQLQDEAGTAGVPLVLLDRERLSRSLAFASAMPGSEIADFITRLRAEGNVDEKCITDVLCERRIYR